MFLRSLNTDPEIKILVIFPQNFNVSFPMFCPNEIDIKQIGSIEPITLTTDTNGYQLIKGLEKPKVINRKLSTTSQYFISQKKEFWTSTTNCFIICINSLGKKVKEIATKSGEMPCDISMSCDGDLLYRDWTQKTVNKIVNGQIKDMIRLEKWKPTNICAISPYDILVVMRNDDNTQSKVVRFSGDEEKQTIQFDEIGKPLYSGNDEIKYIAVNKKKYMRG